MDGADQTTFSFKAPKSEFHSDNERHLRYDSDVARDVSALEIVADALSSRSVRVRAQLQS